jgi:WD repeat-containing protein 23
MSSSHAPTSPPTEGDTARTIVYDPSDPFWRDTEDDDDDMDFVPAEEGTDDNEEGEGDLSFHGIHSSITPNLRFIH